MKNTQGFTLVELMIVVVIVGLLMMYGIPAYQRYVIVSKRTEAHTALVQIAAAEERNNATFLQYAVLMANNVASQTDLGLVNSEFQTSVNYNYTLNNTDGFTATATAKGTSQTNDNFGTDCTVLTINSLGIKTPLACWQ